MKRILLLLAAAFLTVAATAAAAASSGTVVAKLAPNKAGKGSKLTVTSTGPFTGTSGMPQSATVTIQKGFGTDVRSVSKPCTAIQETAAACPAASKIGGGFADVTVTAPTGKIPDSVTFKMYLGVPVQKGDIGSLFLVGQEKLAKQTASATGRLLHTAGGGTQILFSKLPQFKAPPGTTVTLNSLSLFGGASRTVKVKGKKHTYALITNPRTCPKGGWKASSTLTFESGSLVKSLSIACTK